MQKLKILFVEDEPADVLLACSSLRSDGIEAEYRRVVSAPSLREALEEFKPDVIVCDFQIPGYSGPEALELVRTLDPLIPFIFLSGTIGEETAVACLRDGATDYILKGNLQRLPSAVWRAVSEARDRMRTQHIEHSRARLAEILEAATDLVAMIDSNRDITFINEAGCRLLGVKRDELIGRSATCLFAHSCRELIFDEAMPAAMRAGSWRGETSLLTSYLEEIPMSQVIVAHKTADGAARFFSTIARDIRDRRAYEERIHYLAHFDALTGLPNAALLADRGTQAVVAARRSGRVLALALLNVDGFKLIHQGFGRGAGDRLLLEVAAQLRNQLHEGDTVARVGADEFAVLLPDLTRPDDAASVMRRLLDAVSAPRNIGSQSLHITATAGIATFPADGADFDTLLRFASAAMQHAKSTERGTFRYHSGDVTRDAVERLNLETALWAALDRGELSLHYQPVYDLRTARPHGVEALMRWTQADGKHVSPTVFIPIAEETGLINELGTWALEEACTSMLAWDDENTERLALAVNVSTRQLTDDFPDVVASILAKTGFPPERLVLEITESTLMANVESALGILTRLKQLSVRIAIDDFGAGYSSLAYLSRLPIDHLKVDRSFISGSANPKHDAEIVQTIISLGKALGLSIIAEGVESATQLHILKQLGCDRAQGFFLSRPMPLVELLGAAGPSIAQQLA